MANPCYSGPIPVTDDERIVIWKWAKENAIDQGLPIDKVGDAINEKFFGGQAISWLSRGGLLFEPIGGGSAQRRGTSCSLAGAGEKGYSVDAASRQVSPVHFYQLALFREPYSDQSRGSRLRTCEMAHRVKPSCFFRVARGPAVGTESHD